MIIFKNYLQKMLTDVNPDRVVQYALCPDKETKIHLNPLIGQTISLEFSGAIQCLACQRPLKKTFNQGYCFPCFQKLPGCDICQVKPELCHYTHNTCRDSNWGQTHCFIPHTIYLANSSGPKIGITRQYQQQTRWMDQGASQALVLCTVQDRLSAGLIEVAIARHISDKTAWQKLLKGPPPATDLIALAETLAGHIPETILFQRPPTHQIFEFLYPVTSYPEKIKSLNLDNTPHLQGRLQGIKGQYLILDTGVINIRKFGGYQVTIETIPSP